MSAIVAIAWTHICRIHCGQNSKISGWNFVHICHSSRDVSISGFVVHITVSGYRLLSQSLEHPFFELFATSNLPSKFDPNCRVPQITTSGSGCHRCGRLRQTDMECNKCVNSRSGLSKVNNFRTNRKRVCEFLLVIALLKLK